MNQRTQYDTNVNFYANVWLRMNGSGMPDDSITNHTIPAQMQYDIDESEKS